jgi:carboxyl-terminal processing protease
MDPDQFRQASIPLQQEYEGIGAFVDTETEYLTILSPIPNTPAEKAGLKPGDEIIAVDGEDMTGVDGSLVLRKVLGPAGSSVRLTIRRQGEAGAEPQVFDVEIVRAHITIPSVSGKMLENDIAYVQLYQFAANTRGELRKTLQELLDQKPAGMVLDLRNNGGGYLDTAIEVASEFIERGVVLIEEYGDGRRETHQALGRGLATQIPLIVLVNEGTASASEIVAGAIQDYGRGALVGVTTYGKGSVQRWEELSGENGAVRITIARWLTPKERQIHEIGLKPDEEIELTEEDFRAGLDPQLERAIELLKLGAGSPAPAEK